MTEISAEYIRTLHPLDLEPADIAAHIDAQDAKIKALVEAGDRLDKKFGNDWAEWRELRAALAAAKETT